MKRLGEDRFDFRRRVLGQEVCDKSWVSRNHNDWPHRFATRMKGLCASLYIHALHDFPSIRYPKSIPITTMSSKGWVWLSLFACGASSLVLNSGIPLNASPSLSAGSLSPSSTVLSDITALGLDDPYCTEDPYGHPALASCRRAVDKIPDDTARFLFFSRRPPTPITSMTLPYRFVSRKSGVGVETSV